MAILSDAEQQTMVFSFLEIAVGQTNETARQFLQAASWKLEEAIQLFYIGHEGVVATSSVHSPPIENDPLLWGSDLSEQEKDLEDQAWKQNDGDEMRAPLPVTRDVLYDSHIPWGPGATMMGSLSHGAHSPDPFRNFEEEMERPSVWETEQGSSSSMENKIQDNLASLYRPPFSLMFHGHFEQAKENAKVQNKWLLVNVQSTKEFSSHMLNRDTWANEAVAQTIKLNFVFWQVYNDTEEGSKVCTYYNVASIPIILVVDSITGQKMRSWSGMVQPENFLEDLVPFMDASPSDHHISLSHKRPRESSHTANIQYTPDDGNDEDEELKRALAVSMKNNKIDGGNLKEADDIDVNKEVKRPTYLPLPEEPKCDKSMLCRVGVRLPDGRRVQRSFLQTDPIQLLWSFCDAELKKGGDKCSFGLTQAIPGASRTLEFDVNSSFEESGLANSMISVTRE